MESKDGLPVIAFATAAEWEAWLDANHASSKGLWAKIAKKGTGPTTTQYHELLDGALCYGWIDGQKGALDATWWLQKFTPRSKQSRWSQVNQAKVAALTAQGRMRPTGLAEVERAKADGRWEAAYEPPSKVTLPEDLQAALDADPALAEAWTKLNKTNRYAIAYRLRDAKRPETRARRLAEYLQMLREGRSLYP